ncbi:MAG: 1,4-dihydroxy-2-naphthoate polyprenyltransferase [bacterium]
MSGLRLWFTASRPRTLPAASAPVLVGTAAAVQASSGEIKWMTFVAALIGSIFIQIGTNLSNDYSDARRGADTMDRLGPLRVTSAGLVAPRRVLTAAWLAFGVSILCGVYLIYEAGWVILAVGVASILAGVLYTGGPKPYGYAGFGEVFVFLFFGLVAVNGAFYVQLEELDWLPFGLSISVGLLSTAILVVNNFRDMETDRRAGKNTLAVKLGRQATRRIYLAMIGGSFLLVPLLLVLLDGPWLALLTLLAIPFAIGPTRAVTGKVDGPALNGALAGTGVLLAAFGLFCTLGLLLAS